MHTKNKPDDEKPKDPKRPFSRNFIIGVTVQQMIRSVDYSISCSIERLGDFEELPEKNAELLQTLSDLNNMRKQLEDFQTNNPEGFKFKRKQSRNKLEFK